MSSLYGILVPGTKWQKSVSRSRSRSTKLKHQTYCLEYLLWMMRLSRERFINAGLFFYTFLCCKSSVLLISSDTATVKHLKEGGVIGTKKNSYMLKNDEESYNEMIIWKNLHCYGCTLTSSHWASHKYRLWFSLPQLNRLNTFERKGTDVCISVSKL